MLHKFKTTTCASILYLFGLTLMGVAPVFAEDCAAFKQCQQIKPRGKTNVMRQKSNCFRNLARDLAEGINAHKATHHEDAQDAISPGAQLVIDQHRISGECAEALENGIIQGWTAVERQ
jgi:hypothetical protein